MTKKLSFFIEFVGFVNNWSLKNEYSINVNHFIKVCNHNTYFWTQIHKTYVIYHNLNVDNPKWTSYTLLLCKLIMIFLVKSITCNTLNKEKWGEMDGYTIKMQWLNHNDKLMILHKLPYWVYSVFHGATYK